MKRIAFTVVFLFSLPALAQINAGGKKITNLAPGVAGTDAANVAQISASGITSLTGPITGTGPGATATTITNDAVTLGKIADIAANTILGNNTGGALSPLALTTAQVKSILAINAATDITGLATVATSGLASDLAGSLACARMPAISGDGTTSAGACALTLAASGVSAATYGSATQVSVCSIDAKGRATSCTSTTISIPATAISDSTATGRSLVTAANAAAVRTAAGVGTISTQDANNVAITGGTITGMPSPSIGSDVANRDYVLAVASGVSPKAAARVATVSAGTLATSFENGDTVDGTVLATGDRILIKNQASAIDNGIYVVAASGAPARSTDADTGAEILGCSVVVLTGTVNNDFAFVNTNDAAITIGVTSIAWGIFSDPAGKLLAANNLSDVASAPTSRTNLGLVSIASSGSASDLSTGTAACARMPTFTGGDVASAGGTCTLNLSTASVSLAEMANLAANSIIGNNTGGAAVPLALSAAQVTAMLAVFGSGAQGLVPASGGGTTNFLRADGTFAAPPGGGSGLTQGQVIGRQALGGY